MPAELDRLNEFAAQLLAGCREQLATLPVTKYGPVNASKRTSDAMRTEVGPIPEGFRLQLFAPGSILTLIFGRKPGKFPPLLDIQHWIEDKGIVPRPGPNGKAVSAKAGPKGYSTLAYLFARAIANKGNTVHQQGPPSALFANLVSPESIIKQVQSLLLPLFIERVQSQLHAAIVV